MDKEYALRVLLVDDEPAVISGLLAILQANNFACRTASDGFEALQNLRQTLPDVMITDLNMPNMSGFELLSIVRRRFPQIAIIILSGEFIANIQAAGVLMDFFFQKGHYHPSELIAKIHELHLQWPVRSRMAKMDQVPLWIRRNDGNYLVATCTECLRSFPAENAALLPSGLSEIECPSCATKLTYAVDSIVTSYVESLEKTLGDPAAA